MRVSPSSRLTVALLLATAPALAWVFTTPINTKVNGHEFHRIHAEGSECNVALKLSFVAPEAGYKARAKNRNYYRFKARLLFKNGKVLETPPFSNDAPGRRVASFNLDTGGEGCWSKDKVDLKDVDVAGCRGKGCTIESFARVLPEYGH